MKLVKPNTGTTMQTGRARSLDSGTCGGAVGGVGMAQG